MSHYEDHIRLGKIKNSYRTLQQTNQYSCPSKNNTYNDFHNGVNCLCSTDQERSSMDTKMRMIFDCNGNGNNKNGNMNNGNNGNRNNGNNGNNKNGNRNNGNNGNRNNGNNGNNKCNRNY